MARIFIWDRTKAETNLRKHKFSFEEARTAFDDRKGQDEIESETFSEVRWKKVGKVGRTLVVVIYTEWEEGDDEIVRIISARLASRSERRHYEEGAQN
jgi:hypothetical protein